MSTALSKAQQIELLQKIRTDPWEFLKCVRTQDQVDRTEPIKAFPVHLDYLRLFVRLWVDEPFIAVPKSRRMRMTWVCVSLYLWDTLWHKGRANAIVSKKEDDADELIRRALFIHRNLDIPGLPRALIPKVEYKYGKLTVPELDSYMQGFPQGAEQLRQFTFSGIFGDECAFWPDAQAMYSASFPTLQGGGRMTLVSSPAPGFFRALCEDRLDELGGTGAA